MIGTCRSCGQTGEIHARGLDRPCYGVQWRAGTLDEFPPVHRGRTVGTERKIVAQALAQRYAAGESIRALAAATGRSYAVVHAMLGEAGVAMRPRGGPRARYKRARLTPLQHNAQLAPAPSSESAAEEVGSS